MDQPATENIDWEELAKIPSELKEKRQLSRDVVDFLDKYCYDRKSIEWLRANKAIESVGDNGKPFKLAFPQWESMKPTIDSACLAREADRTLEQTRLLAKEQFSSIGRNIRNIDSTISSLGGKRSTPFTGAFNDLKKSVRENEFNIINSIHSVQKLFADQRSAAEQDVKDLVSINGNLRTFTDMVRVQRERDVLIQQMQCKDRPVVALRRACKQHVGIDCHSINRVDLVKLLCK